MAIAFDAGSSGGINNVSSSSQTIAHTCTGSNLVLIATTTVYSGGPANNVSGMTYNGVAMTQLASQVSGIWTIYFFYLLNPATGTNNIVISFSPNCLYSLVANASYTGVKQSGFPDATAVSGTSSPATESTIVGTITTSANNCWTVMAANGQDGNISNGAGTTIRATSTSLAREVICDSNGVITPAGSNTLTVNINTDVGGYIITSMAPALYNPGTVQVNQAVKRSYFY